MRRIWHGSEAEALALKPHGAAALISITEPGRIAPLPYPDGWHALLRIQCADAEYDASMLARAIKRGEPFDPVKKGFPCRGVAERIRDFVVQVESMPISSLLVHCHSGERRSAAVAQFVADRWGQAAERSTNRMNQTLYALLRDPSCLDATSKAAWSRRLRDVARAWVEQLVGRHRHGRR